MLLYLLAKGSCYSVLLHITKLLPLLDTFASSLDHNMAKRSAEPIKLFGPCQFLKQQLKLM